MRSVFIALLCATAMHAEIRVGIVGTDTSHVVAFTKLLNDPLSPDHVSGAVVVAAFKGGSPDVESSASRVNNFAEELRTKWKVKFYPDIATMCKNVDAVLLERSTAACTWNRRRRYWPRISRCSSTSPWRPRSLMPAKSRAWRRLLARPGSAHPACATAILRRR